MACDCSHTNAQYENAETCCPSKPWSDGDRKQSRQKESAGCSNGLLYRKKLERGFINYREVLNEDRRHEAISTFHIRRPGQRHLSLEETYKCVAENYWWEGMYFEIRDFVLSCPECQHNKKSEVSVHWIVSHSSDMLSKLRSQREAGLFCDITLRTSGRSFLAHRAVLAAVSDHFQEIFTEMDSSMKADIDLTGKSGHLGATSLYLSCFFG
uniref:BTB domain-containing protein n=1 Tax=Astatotilapia calliptera TaxID=8154 RepID=A0AAX7TQP9_ASTCA